MQNISKPLAQQLLNLAGIVCILCGALLAWGWPVTLMMAGAALLIMGAMTS